MCWNQKIKKKNLDEAKKMVKRLEKEAGYRQGIIEDLSEKTNDFDSLLESSFDCEERIYEQVKEKATSNNDDKMCNILTIAKLDSNLKKFE